MNQNNLDLLPEDIREEFSVEPDGKIYASRRATARLSGMKSDHPINNLLNNILHQKNLSKPLQPFAGQNFKAAPKLPDTLVGAIVVHYALKGREQAIDCMTAFNNIGIRTWFQQQLGWQPEIKPEKPLSSAELLVKQAQELLEHEQRLNQHDQEINKLGNLYNLVAQNINVTNQHRLEVLMAIHESDMLAEEDPSPVPLRKTIWKLVNKFANATNCLPEEAWNYFYKELKDRYGFDAKARKKNQKLNFALDAVEQEPGMLENLHKIVSAEIRNFNLPTPQLVKSDLTPLNPHEDCFVISANEAKVGDIYDEENGLFYRFKSKANKD